MCSSTRISGNVQPRVWYTANYFLTFLHGWPFTILSVDVVLRMAVIKSFISLDTSCSRSAFLKLPRRLCAYFLSSLVMLRIKGITASEAAACAFPFASALSDVPVGIQ